MQDGVELLETDVAQTEFLVSVEYAEGGDSWAHVNCLCPGQLLWLEGIETTNRVDGASSHAGRQPAFILSLLPPNEDTKQRNKDEVNVQRKSLTIVSNIVRNVDLHAAQACAQLLMLLA